jgi:hypothetical protein
MNQYKVMIRYAAPLSDESEFEVTKFSTYSEALQYAYDRVGTEVELDEDSFWPGLLAKLRGTVSGQVFALATIEVSA